MGALSSKLRSLQGGGIAYWCQGCNQHHHIQVGQGPGPRWGWNGDVDLPTFTPSVLVRGIREDMDEATQAAYDAIGPGQLRQALDDPRFRTICHTFITDGRVQFLGDCTHQLAGQTLALPDLPRVE